MSTADNESPDTTQIVTVEELYSTEQTEGTRSQTLYFGKAGMNRFVHSSRDLILCCASHVSHCETYYFFIFWPADPVMSYSKSCFTADACLSTLTKKQYTSSLFYEVHFSKVQVYFLIYLM